MDIVGLREANQHFARYIKMVREGHEIVLTERGKPVAVIKPITENEDEAPLQQRLSELERAGIIRCATLERLVLPEPVVASGSPISDTLGEMRRERY